MSHHHHDNCCYVGPGYGMGGFGRGSGIIGDTAYGGWGIRWIYALSVLILIVLQFGKVNREKGLNPSPCCQCGIVDTAGTGDFYRAEGTLDGQLIDNSVLFIIVLFLLILCGGCWTGGWGNYGNVGGAGFRGYGYY